MTACQRSIEHSKLGGNKIIAALEKYKKAEGVYPESLEQMIPNYLDQIVSPSYGEQVWRYFPDAKRTSFSLSFTDKQGNMTTTWHSDRRFWNLVDF
jgi:hypothetical protein